MTDLNGWVTDYHEKSNWEPIEGLDASWCRIALGGPGESDAPQIWLAESPPYFVIPRHHHGVHRVEILLAGSYTMGDRELRAGAVTAFPANVPYGPLHFGPEGGTFVEIFSDSSKLQAVFENPEDLSDSLVAVLQGMGMKPATAGNR
jgi:hypothetical protein